MTIANKTDLKEQDFVTRKVYQEVVIVATPMTPARTHQPHPPQKSPKFTKEN